MPRDTHRRQTPRKASKRSRSRQRSRAAAPERPLGAGRNGAPPPAPPPPPIPPNENAALTRIWLSAGESHAETAADHWKYLTVRGSLALKLAREEHVRERLFAPWERLLKNNLPQSPSGVRDALGLAAIEGLKADAVGSLVDGLTAVAATTIPSAMAYVMRCGLPACVATDLWEICLAECMARACGDEIPPPFPPGGFRPWRTPSEPFVFQPSSTASLEEGHAQLHRQYTSYLMTGTVPSAAGKMPRDGGARLRRYIDWYYRHRVGGVSVRALSRESGATRSTVEYGLNEVVRLLELATLKFDPLPK